MEVLALQKGSRIGVAVSDCQSWNRHVLGFPPETRDLPVAVTFTPKGKGELWQHDFAGRRGRVHFHVEIINPLPGLIVRYKGWLIPENPA